MITYPQTKYYYIIERAYFIYRLFILFISTFSFLLFFIQYHGRIREIISIPVWTYRFYIMFYIINTMKLNIRQFYNKFLLTIQKRSRFELALLQSTICSYALMICLLTLMSLVSDCLWYYCLNFKLNTWRLTIDLTLLCIAKFIWCIRVMYTKVSKSRCSWQLVAFMNFFKLSFSRCFVCNWFFMTILLIHLF